MAKGNEALAVSQLSRALQLEPERTLTNYHLGEAHYRQGDEIAAVECWRAARAAPFLINRAGTEALRGNRAEALHLLRIATQVDPDHYNAWLYLGNENAALDRFEEACAAYDEAIARHPDEAEAYEKLALLYVDRLRLPDQANAVVTLGLANAQRPSARLWALRSQLASDAGDFETAMRSVRKAIALDSTNGNYLVLLGDLYMAQKLYPQALAQFKETGAKGGPAWMWTSRQRMGHVYAAQGNLDAAITEYRAAVLGSLSQKVTARTVAENYVILGDALRKAARTNEARLAFEAALEREPSNALAASRLVELKLP